MKRLFTICFMVISCMSCMAQSSEATYPVGTWQSDPEKADVFVDMTIERVTAPNPDFGNKKICGTLSINGDPSYEASLTYSGRGIDNKDRPMDVFFFNVVSKQNKTSKIAIRKMLKEGAEFGNVVKIKIVQVTGDLANNPALKQQLYSVGGGNGSAYDPTPYAITDKELLDALKEGIANGSKLEGFGNVRQFIAAHEKLASCKMKYAKCKGAGSVNIREKGEANAEKIGELRPGTTLPVVDEYDGWCQVRMSEKQFGWISLGVVTLTNIEGT